MLASLQPSRQSRPLLRDEDVPELRGEQRERIITVLDRFRVAKSDAGTKDRSCDAQVFENGLNRGLKRAHHEATPMSLCWHKYD